MFVPCFPWIIGGAEDCVHRPPQMTKLNPHHVGNDLIACGRVHRVMKLEVQLNEAGESVGCHRFAALLEDFEQPCGFESVLSLASNDATYGSTASRKS